MATDAKAANGDERTISLAEMKSHTTEQSCWIAVRGSVYDVTPFIDEHPGGFDIIISNTGESLSFSVVGRRRPPSRERQSLVCVLCLRPPPFP